METTQVRCQSPAAHTPVMPSPLPTQLQVLEITKLQRALGAFAPRFWMFLPMVT